MLTRRQFALAAAAAGSMGVVHTTQSAQAATWQPLFDGRSLRGWHTNPQKIGHGTGGRWQVREGVIIGEQEPPGSGNGGLLLTDEKFGDFELSLEMNPDWGPCSGVFFRCTDQGAGFQMYVDYHDGGNVGHLRGEMPGAFAMMPFKIYGELSDNRLTRLTSQPDPRAEKWPPGVYRSICSAADWLDVWKVGQWNTARIRCQGRYPRVTTWINDLQVSDFDGDKCTLPGYDKERVFKLLGRSGSIGLQVHGGKGWPKGAVCRWRNIRIRRLG